MQQNEALHNTNHVTPESSVGGRRAVRRNNPNHGAIQIMSRDRVQLAVEFVFRRIPIGWSLEKDTQGRLVAVPAVPQVRSVKLSTIDGWDLRRRFLRLKPRDRKAAFQFLQEVGVWHVEPDPKASLEKGNKLLSGAFGARVFNGWVLPVLLDDFLRGQQGWLKTLRDPQALKKRFGAPPGESANSGQKLSFGLQTATLNQMPMHIEWRRGGALGVIETITGREIMVATTHLGMLHDVHFRNCARADCRIPFPRLSDHKQIYCSTECAHVMAQRELRKRRKEEQKRLAIAQFGV